MDAKKKVLFLDIDGVLNSERTCSAFNGYPQSLSETDVSKFDHVAIGLIRNISRSYGVKIVLSSYWRICYSIEDISKALDLDIEDKTPVYGDDSHTNPFSSRYGTVSNIIRGEEIRAWLMDNPRVETYAIVDDTMCVLPEQEPYFVRTDEKEGFSFENYVKLKQILKLS